MSKTYAMSMNLIPSKINGLKLKLQIRSLNLDAVILQFLSVVL